MKNTADAVPPGKLAVRFATIGSTQPAREYLESECAADERVQILRRCERLAAVGTIANREQFRQVAGSLFEIKAHQARVSCYRNGDAWWLLHGFTKKKDKWPEAEVERATRLMEAHRARPG